MRRPSLGYVVAVVAAVGLMNAVAFKADAQSQLTLLSLSDADVGAFGSGNV